MTRPTLVSKLVFTYCKHCNQRLNDLPEKSQKKIIIKVIHPDWFSFCNVGCWEAYRSAHGTTRTEV